MKEYTLTYRGIQTMVEGILHPTPFLRYLLFFVGDSNHKSRVVESLRALDCWNFWG